MLEAEAELTQRELAKALARQQDLERALSEALVSNATMRQEQENTAGMCLTGLKSLLKRTLRPLNMPVVTLYK